jgi:hypothetical protein
MHLAIAGKLTFAIFSRSINNQIPVQRIKIPMRATEKIQRIIAPEIPLPPQKKFITREDMVNIFQHGARALTWTAAVAALKKVGFGKSAAYEALSVIGCLNAAI